MKRIVYEATVGLIVDSTERKRLSFGGTELHTNKRHGVRLMVETLDSNALAEEKPASRIKTLTMDRRVLIVTAAVIGFLFGFGIKQVASRDDTMRPVTVVELPQIPPGAELSLSGAAQ